MQLTRKQILSLNQAHRAFAQTEDPKQPWKLGPKVRYSLLRNTKALHSAVESIFAVQDALIREVSGGAETIAPNTPEMAEYQKRWIEFIDGKEELKLFVVDIEALRLDENNINLALLADLGPVIVEPADVVPAPQDVPANP